MERPTVLGQLDSWTLDVWPSPAIWISINSPYISYRKRRLFSIQKGTTSHGWIEGSIVIK
jgi:hypothetical protein